MAVMTRKSGVGRAADPARLGDGDRRIRLSINDVRRLRTLLNGARRSGMRDPLTLGRLEERLDAARLYLPEQLPLDVVSLYSRVRFLNEDQGEFYEYSLVFPGEADVRQGRISVLSPIGSSLLGRSVGDVVPCRVPGGDVSLRIVTLIRQPEREGEF